MKELDKNVHICIKERKSERGRKSERERKNMRKKERVEKENDNVRKEGEKGR